MDYIEKLNEEWESLSRRLHRKCHCTPSAESHVSRFKRFTPPDPDSLYVLQHTGDPPHSNLWEIQLNHLSQVPLMPAWKPPSQREQGYAIPR